MKPDSPGVIRIVTFTRSIKFHGKWEISIIHQTFLIGLNNLINSKRSYIIERGKRERKKKSPILKINTFSKFIRDLQAGPERPFSTTFRARYDRAWKKRELIANPVTARGWKWKEKGVGGETLGGRKKRLNAVRYHGRKGREKRGEKKKEKKKHHQISA